MKTYGCDNKDKVIPAKDFVIIRLKKEIDTLADRLSERLKKENELLKKEIAVLKGENARLYRALREKNGILRFNA
ncbi:MAG: hypothetical protein J5911_04125 [Clostridia bacterium]|nr:hypothetical protein [Clostridia bacterium]MBO4518216.1 hypothetical protein [Clostridia bacterium]